MNKRLLQFFAKDLVDAIKAKTDKAKWGKAVQWGFDMAALFVPESKAPTLERINEVISEFWDPIIAKLWPNEVK